MLLWGRIYSSILQYEEIYSCNSMRTHTYTYNSMRTHVSRAESVSIRRPHEAYLATGTSGPLVARTGTRGHLVASAILNSRELNSRETVAVSRTQSRASIKALLRLYWGSIKALWRLYEGSLRLYQGSMTTLSRHHKARRLYWVSITALLRRYKGCKALLTLCWGSTRVLWRPLGSIGALLRLNEGAHQERF